MGLEDDSDGDNSLVVPGFGQSAAGAAWWVSAGVMGGVQGGVGPCVDDVVPGLGCGGGIGSGTAVVVMRFPGFGGGGAVSGSWSRQRVKLTTTPVRCILQNRKAPIWEVICYSMG